MKIVQVPFVFYPEPHGGTEIYVEQLSRSLIRKGHEVIVAVPGSAEGYAEHAGIPVFRFGLEDRRNKIRSLYGQEDSSLPAQWKRFLEREKPDVLHLHAFIPGVTPALLRGAKERKIPVLFTYHTPTVTCQRGTLLKWGKEVCEGRMQVDLCTGCTLQGLGVFRPVARGLGRIPMGLSDLGASMGFLGKGRLALGMRSLMALRLATTQTFLEQADHIVAVSEWVKMVLEQNNVPSRKITVSRHGLIPAARDSAAVVNVEARPSGGPESGKGMRLVYAGRLSSEKGAHILIEAVCSQPALPVALDIYGVIQGEGQQAYLKQLKHQIGQDSRIRIFINQPREQFLSKLGTYDFLAVPSQWLETGPLVVLEAFHAGVPVLGSRLGGIAEWVEHESNGLLVEPFSVSAWVAVLRRIIGEKALPQKLRRGILHPREMEEVAEEMELLYRKWAARGLF